MADLSEKQASLSVKIVGADSTGLETNFVDAISAGRLKIETRPEGDASSDLINGNMYVASTNAISLTLNTEQDFLLIKNPNGNTVNLYLMIHPQSNVVSTSSVTWRLYKSPTVTANGTSITINNMDIGSSNTSAAQIFSQPTATVNGTLLNVSLTSAGADVTPFGMYILEANQTMLLTAQPSSVNTLHAASIKWSEK